MATLGLSFNPSLSNMQTGRQAMYANGWPLMQCALCMSALEKGPGIVSCALYMSVQVESEKEPGQFCLLQGLMEG